MSSRGSEGNLWDRMRNAIGHLGHFDRLEFNPTDGIPDVTFCANGIEGHIELKFRREEPKRASTAPFHSYPNLREAQEVWINKRVSHGGRVFILAQIGKRVYLLHGSYASRFNSMTVAEFAACARWIGGPRILSGDWDRFIAALRQPFSGAKT